MPNYRQSIAHFLLKERKVNIVSEIPDRIKCIICKNVIINAMQSPCGCHYCFDCINCFLNGETKFCPGQSIYCQEEKIKMNDNVVEDFSTDREIRQLKFRCQNTSCNFEDEVRLMDEHYQNCLYGLENCELCNIEFLRMDIDKHMNEDCPNRLVTCQFCGIDFKAQVMIDEHLSIKSDKLCKKFVGQCPLKCDIKDDIVVCKHLLVCANRPRNCPYDVVGCPAQGYTKRQLNGHIKEHLFEHSTILFTKLKQYKDELDLLKNRYYDAFSFVWKINNFSSLSRSLSPEFNVGKCSYVAQLELNIVGENVELYFCIVEGEYDDILQWPFTKNVTISLMDQSGEQKHYVKVLKPTLKQNGIMKYEGKRKGLGWDKFVDLSTLRAYDTLVKNNRLFIKCEIEL